MASFNVHEAKTNLSQLLKRTAAGEEVVIMSNGQPVAQLIPYQRRKQKIRLGFAAGQLQESPGWEKPLTTRQIAKLLSGK